MTTPETNWLLFAKAERKPAERKIPTGVSQSSE